MKIVIIGASFAGISAAIASRKKYPQAEISLIDKQATVGYLSGGLSAYFNHTINELHEARYITEEELRRQKIQLLLNREVVAMDVENQLIAWTRKEEQQWYSYDKLILATGASQFSTQIRGSQTEKLLKYKFLSGALAAVPLLEKSQTVAVIGAGPIGMEAIDFLVKMKKTVHVFESLENLLPKYFDKEMVAEVQKSLEKQAVIFHFEETVLGIEETANGIVLETAETFYAPLVNNAVRTGLVVANNLEEKTHRFIGSLRTMGTKVGDYYLASTGLTETEGLFFPQTLASVIVRQPAPPLQHGTEILGKLIYDKLTQRVLGAQLCSKNNCLEKINTLALSIQTGQTLTDLLQKDYFYQPSLTNIYDITNLMGASAYWRENDES
ncbi:FAD-dependent oxidoreductase [Enterococcus faecalis]|uniref:FAD-dependent oxidoreductase n=1 Tax=Enterococcus faecalis TaxID=1351 RepID=UPI0022255EA4|nr:FAD-dependent oxidoreductase [Enterococcus faecalis]UYY34741.1 FAD-dependent oxidoreductase [Enterococcus faecalis]UYY37560.1 FAD-dependent oxidoreductase [Enterococcus faecalis]HCR3094184.1 FAD-dependent oxidoreductase [Enterococcus faecalis]HCR3969517.1 FAD-dependent oxidoreductase [Enterococcus faecalis]